MFARFDEIPAMTLQDIKETKRYGHMHGQRENSFFRSSLIPVIMDGWTGRWTHTCTDNMKTVSSEAV